MPLLEGSLGRMLGVTSGVDLADPDTAYFCDTTGLDIVGSIGLENLHFTAAVGPLSFGVRDTEVHTAEGLEISVRVPDEAVDDPRCGHARATPRTRAISSPR